MKNLNFSSVWRPAGLTLRQLRWLGVILPLIFLGLLDLVRHAVWPELLHTWPGFLLIGALVAAATYLFSKAMFDAIEQMQARLFEQNRALEAAYQTVERQNRQLKALHEAGLSVVSDLNLDAVLGRVIGLARELVGAKAGLLEVLDEEGRLIRRIEAPTGAAGLNTDPAVSLEVPIVARGHLLGRLYLAEKVADGRVVPFEAADREVLELFATQAAVAIDNARLHSRLEALAVVAERERIARELHDNLAQVLGYIRMRAASARRALEGGDLSAVGRVLCEVDEAVAEAYADVREAILGLRSRVGGERALPDALREYLERFRQQSGLEVEFEADPAAREVRLLPQAEVHLLRIIQEALTNVRKHARAGRVRVGLGVLADGDRRLRVEVADDGCGFDPTAPPPGGHFGLAVMRERAELAGGRLEVYSAPGRGTRVLVEVPIAEAVRG
jgi:nitrate/nitrite-specific signal transduction histidine kinase